MKLPEFLRKQAEKQLFGFCRQVADDQHHPRHVRYRIVDQQINLVEVRRYENNPKEHKEFPVAQIRYIPELNQWTLHQYSDERWKLYLNVTPTLDLSKLLSVIRQDPMRCFWPE